MTFPSGLWAEGDSLSPTNLNRRNPVGTFPAKTYHVAWAAGTGTTQINNAITNALAGGYDTVFIDASRLPYDASAVTFNTAIRMTCEGAAHQYEARAYGADLSGATDSYAAIQATITAAGNADMHFGAGTLLLSQPIWCNASRSHVFGEGVDATILKPTFKAGPALYVHNATATGHFPLATALIGTGNAFSSTNQWLDLRDSETCDLNGLAALTVECFFNTTNAASPAFQNLISSTGIDNTNVSSSAIQLYVDSGTLNGRVTATSGQINISGGTVNANTTYHAALVFDGTTTRLFLAGQQVASIAQTGTIVQTTTEQVLIGPGGGVYDAGAAGLNGLAGPIDLPRISNSARYTANFTPSTTRFTSDANTLCLLTFDTQVGQITKGLSSAGDLWLPLRPLSEVYRNDQAHFADFTIQNIGLETSGIFASASGSVYERLRFVNCRIGGYFGQNSFFSTIRDCTFLGAGHNRFNIIVNFTSGITKFSNINMQGGIYPLYINASSGEWDNIHIVVDNRSRCHAFISGGIQALNGVVFSTEAVSSTVFSHTVHTEAQCTFTGCTFNTLGSAPYLRVRFGPTLCSGCYFDNTTGTPTSVSQFVTPFTLPLRFDNCVQNGTWTPWSDTTGTFVLGSIGPRFSSSTGGTLRFDASLADEWDLTLTSDVTQSSWQSISYGQPVSGAIKMDSTGSRLFVWPTNSKGTVTLSYGSAAVNTFTGFYDGVNVILTSVRTGL